MQRNPKIVIFSQYKVLLTLLEHIKEANMSLATDLFMIYKVASIGVLLHFSKVLLI